MACSQCDQSNFFPNIVCVFANLHQGQKHCPDTYMVLASFTDDKEAHSCAEHLARRQIAARTIPVGRQQEPKQLESDKVCPPLQLQEHLQAFQIMVSFEKQVASEYHGRVDLWDFEQPLKRVFHFFTIEAKKAKTCVLEVKIIHDDVQCLCGVEVVFARAHYKQFDTGDFAESKNV